jgi:hypothetical protein
VKVPANASGESQLFKLKTLTQSGSNDMLGLSRGQELSSGIAGLSIGSFG